MAYRMHREGRAHVPVSFLVLASIVAAAYYFLPDSFLWFGHLLALCGVVLFGLVVNFFRNPIIPITQHPDQVLCPCDGKVVVIEEINDTAYFNGKVLQISIFMSPLNVHVNRNPISGTVKTARYLPGKFLMAFNPKSSTDNEMTYVVTDNGRFEVGYKQIAGFLARRICMYIKDGDKVEQGGEFGFIKFGSRIDLLLPTNADVKVKLGDVVFGGRTVIAEVK